MVVFKEYNTSDTVVEFVARDEEYPKLTCAILCVTSLVFVIFPMLRVPAAIVCCYILYVLWYTVVEESVTLIKEFGIQIRAKYFFDFAEDVLFVDHHKLDGQLLQECIVGNSVRFYLSFIVRGEKSLTVVFKHVYPGLPALQKIFKALSPSTTESESRSSRHHNPGSKRTYI